MREKIAYIKNNYYGNYFNKIRNFAKNFYISYDKQ